jgi:hypothetical protein
VLLYFAAKSFQFEEKSFRSTLFDDVAAIHASSGSAPGSLEELFSQLREESQLKRYSRDLCGSCRAMPFPLLKGGSRFAGNMKLHRQRLYLPTTKILLLLPASRLGPQLVALRFLLSPRQS